MMKVLSSATRIVLVFIVITLCLTTSYIVYKNSEKETVVTAVLWVFSNVAVAIVAFYFKDSRSNAGNEKQQEKQDEWKDDLI